jgi:hypothetical protein
MKAAARNGDLTVAEAVQQIFGISQARVDSASPAEHSPTDSSSRPTPERSEGVAEGSTVSAQQEKAAPEREHEAVESSPSLEAARR